MTQVFTSEPKITKKQALEASRILREEAKQKGLQDLTLEEINEEIRLSRQEGGFEKHNGI